MNLVLSPQMVRHRALHIAQLLGGAIVGICFVYARPPVVKQQTPPEVFFQALERFKLLSIAFAAQAGELGQRRFQNLAARRDFFFNAGKAVRQTKRRISNGMLSPCSTSVVKITQNVK